MINETPFLCLTTHRALRDTAGESVGEAVSGRESCFTKTGQEPTLICKKSEEEVRSEAEGGEHS